LAAGARCFVLQDFDDPVLEFLGTEQVMTETDAKHANYSPWAYGIQ